jgi:hypothetical protein
MAETVTGLGRRLGDARPILHAALLVFAVGYLLLVPFGGVARENRWGTEEVVLLGVALVLSSRLIDSLSDFHIGKEGFGAKFRRLEERQSEQEEQLLKQKAEIRSLQVALQGIVSRYELDKLVGLHREEPFQCYYSDDLFEELKHLRAMDLVRNHEGTGLADLRRQFKDKHQQFDLKRFFYITEQGREYLTLRKELLAAVPNPYQGSA